MIKKVTLCKQSLKSQEHLIIATPEKYDPQSQRILFSLNNNVAAGIYNDKTKNVTAKIIALQANANNLLAPQLPQNATMRVKVFVYDFLKDKILGAKLQEFEYNSHTLDYHPSDELLSTSPVIMECLDEKWRSERKRERR